jgi:hypothetical protein
LGTWGLGFLGTWALGVFGTWAHILGTLALGHCPGALGVLGLLGS